MAYLEVINPERRWLKNPVIYNRPGEKLYLIRVGCHVVDMCIPYCKSMDWNNAASRIYWILKNQLGVDKKILRINTKAQMYIEKEVMFQTSSYGGVFKPAIVVELIVKKPIQTSILFYYKSDGVIYHEELINRQVERVYP